MGRPTECHTLLCPLDDSVTSVVMLCGISDSSWDDCQDSVLGVSSVACAVLDWVPLLT